MMDPLEIRQKEFKKSLWGYNREQVKDFIEEVASAVEDLLLKQHLLKEKLSESENRYERYRELEEALKNALVMAQKNAQDLKESAVKENEMIIQNAHQQAAIIIQQAEKKGEEMIAEAKEKVKEIIREYQELYKQIQAFRVHFRAFLNAQLDMLANHEKNQQSGWEIYRDIVSRANTLNEKIKNETINNAVNL